MIVIGDVHGRFDLLMELVNKLPYADDLCFVGDIIDRGHQSKEVVDFIIDNNHKCVLGNHEEFLNFTFIDGINDPKMDTLQMWLQNGGYDTLNSFGNFEENDLDILSLENYLDWFRSLPLYIEHKHFLITHSYAHDGKNTPRDDLLWDRMFWKPIVDDVINIFGHTQHFHPTKYHDKHWCIDTGSYQTGILTAVDLKTMQFYQTGK